MEILALCRKPEGLIRGLGHMNTRGFINVTIFNVIWAQKCLLGTEKIFLKIPRIIDGGNYVLPHCPLASNNISAENILILIHMRS